MSHYREIGVSQNPAAGTKWSSCLESFLLVSQQRYTSGEEVPQGSWSQSFSQFMAQFLPALARNASWDADKGTLPIQIPASSLYGCARCDHVYNLHIIYVYTFLHIRKRSCPGTQDLPEFPGKAATCNGSVKSCPCSTGLGLA